MNDRKKAIEKAEKAELDGLWARGVKVAGNGYDLTNLSESQHNRFFHFDFKI